MPTPNAGFYAPGPNSVLIPEAATELQTRYGRSPSTFQLSRYVRILSGQDTTGFYLETSPNTGSRVVLQTDFLWPDGQKRPRNFRHNFRWKAFQCERYNYGYLVGNRTVDMARWDLVADHAQVAAQICMTARTLEAITLLTTTGTYPAANTVADIDTHLGTTNGNWYSGATAANEYPIRQSILKASETIMQSTGGMVKLADLILVVNPTTARQMGASPEIQGYVTQHEQAMANLNMSQDPQGLLSQFGLPPQLYGVDVCVEDAVRVTDRPDAGDDAATAGWVMGDDEAVLLTKPGAPTENADVPTFASCTQVFKEEMTVEAQVDAWNRVTEGAVVDDRDTVMSSNLSAFFFQDVATP